MASMGRQARTRSALVEAAQTGDASILAVFGGQGTHNPQCLQLLWNLWRENRQPQVQRLIAVAAASLKKASDAPEAAFEFSAHGFDLAQWLSHPETAPTALTAATAPISIPINGLVSLVTYAATCCALDLHPGQLRQGLAGTTGHSQGIVNSAVVAAASDWETFYRAAADAMALLLWIGLESHLATPGSMAFQRTGPVAAKDTGCMMSVKGFTSTELEKILNECNSVLDDHEKIFLALKNSDDIMTVSGPAKNLNGLRVLLQERGAPPGLDQVKIPFPQRKQVVSCTELPISAAFHSAHLADAAQELIDRLEASLFSTVRLTIPVYNTNSGEDISNQSGRVLVASLIRMIMCESVDWQKSCVHKGITHILDFGPSKTSILLRDRVTGTGVRIILVSESGKASDTVGYRDELFSGSPLVAPVKWASEFGPRLRQDDSGNLQLVTRMTAMLNLPPVMVAGMTPTTVPQDFVASITKAGYHVELAGGGYAQAKDMEKALRQLAASIPPSGGITCNLIYVNPRAMSWQIPLIRRLRQEGLPIEGLAIGAGVPSASVASEYIETLGLKHIAFKPSSVDSIKQVLDIAQAYPTFPIMLQWTGGRAGGHHSYEDLHTPILKTYAAIRGKSNVILTVGSGFGDAEGMLPYLTGEWSESIGFARMPFDGVLLGSRMMVAKEAHTSLAVKQLIVDTAGVTDSQWHNTYGGAAGGVITVKSEMGEPIHKIANKAVLLWYDLDKTVFSVKDQAKRMALLQKRRVEIINRLNTEYAKPWFAMNSYQRPVDIADLTYAECLHRIAKLMYLTPQQKWIHESYAKFFHDFATRTVERHRQHGKFAMDDRSPPQETLRTMINAMPTIETDLLYPDDVAFFIGLCKRRGQKPVNFIPRLDETFETWFKKDSLWQMETLEACPDQDPQRVCIIHGPVAAKYSTSVDESAGEILDKIQSDLISSLKSVVPIDDGTALSTTVSAKRSLEARLSQLMSVHATVDRQAVDTKVTCVVKREMLASEVKALLKALDCGEDHWLHVSLMSQYISYGQSKKPNRIRSAFNPIVGDVIIATFDRTDESVVKLVIECKLPGVADAYTAWSLSSEDGKEIQFTLGHPKVYAPGVATIQLKYFKQETGGQQVLSDISPGHDDSVRNFYSSLWLRSLDDKSQHSVQSTFAGGSTDMTSSLVRRFDTLVSKALGQPSAMHAAKGWAPIDLGVIVGWEALTKPLLTGVLGGDITRLLHQSNTFELMPGVDSLGIGQKLEASSRITSVSVQPKGKSVEIAATLSSAETPVMKVTSQFFIQGEFEDENQSFTNKEDAGTILKVDSAKVKALLLSRSWYTPETRDISDKTLLFKTHSATSGRAADNTLDVQVTGTAFDVTTQGVQTQVGFINFTHKSCAGNPVTDFLKRHGSPEKAARPIEAPGWSEDAILIQVRDLGQEYSVLSKDLNPIHVSPVFAGFAGQPSPIIHGMYTSAIVRNAIEQHMNSTGRSTFRRWSASFEDTVRGGDVLRIEIKHVGMISGCMSLEVEVFNEDTKEKVMKASADVEQTRTAYVFTGQGSQDKNMGMASYHTDPVVKAAWDTGDRYLFNLYGFSLLNLVRDNPKKLTIHFGTAKGRKIRENYLGLTKKVTIDGKVVAKPILEHLTPSSTSITFEEPRGLLFSTQFAQPAICLMEAAEVAGLKARGLIQQDAMYAGHSLGEYTALHACAEFMSLEGLMGLTFYRGLMMQNQMKRDAHGRTEFSMMAVDPSRVRKGFKEADLQTTVKQISSATGMLLEIVNFNIAEQQYVCAGHLRALYLLGKICDALSTTSPAFPLTSDLTALINTHLPTARSLPDPIELARGKATIPLSGVNVPFHSSYLHGGIETYRDYLLEHFSKDDVVLERIKGKFIPNVTAVPFATTKEYVEMVVGVTGSERLRGVVEGMA